MVANTSDSRSAVRIALKRLAEKNPDNFSGSRMVQPSPTAGRAMLTPTVTLRHYYE